MRRLSCLSLNQIIKTFILCLSDPPTSLGASFKDSFVDKEERTRSVSISIKEPREAITIPSPIPTAKLLNQEAKCFVLPAQIPRTRQTAVGHFVIIKEFSLFAQVGSIAVCRMDGLNQVCKFFVQRSFAFFNLSSQ